MSKEHLSYQTIKKYFPHVLKNLEAERLKSKSPDADEKLQKFTFNTAMGITCGPGLNEKCQESKTFEEFSENFLSRITLSISASNHRCILQAQAFRLGGYDLKKLPSAIVNELLFQWKFTLDQKAYAERSKAK